MEIWLIRIWWSLLGSLAFVGGIIGILVPLVPRIPFFLVTVYCLTKISTRFTTWLQFQPWYHKLFQLGAKFTIVRKLLPAPSNK